MLSLHTNNAALSAQNSLSRTQSSLSTSMTRLSTGFRINSAMDDAAGLQIATRLKAQTSGMSVAMRNTQNSISMLQTAEGALDEVTNILTRMKDLATQAADGSSSDADRTAMQAEYTSLTDELTNIVKNTTFGGTELLNNSTGKLKDAVSFQIGASTGEKMSLDLRTELNTMHKNIYAAAGKFNGGSITVDAAGAPAVWSKGGEGGKELVATIASEATGLATGASNANGSIDRLKTAIESVSTLRSSLGAAANRLDHVHNNLANISTNTANATGRIMDVDFATESAKMTSSQMLMQAGTAMLKQSNSMSSMVMSLLQ
ncbi:MULTISPECIES: flagellin [unclassified Massilia]|uniref:flagellin N-terminal helical domain-containing protein n=1 Tax=unclassified Massilia TaxID=2609279 RepID=UPI0004E4694A|nr:MULTISPECIES: flagellin [unclassified Massilia]KFC61888.1 Flagellin domain protein [Massilia sp. LC238]